MVPHGRRMIRRRLWLPGVALGGVWATHVVAYLVAAPDPHERLALLGTTRHDYLSVAGPFAISVVIAGLVGFVLDRSRRRGAIRTVTVRELARLLIVLQLLGFLGLESSERLIHGAPLEALVEPVVGIGLVLQVLTACVAAFVLFALGHAVELVLRSRRRIPRRSPDPLPRPAVLLPVRRPALAAGGRTLRGPPFGV